MTAVISPLATPGVPPASKRGASSAADAAAASPSLAHPQARSSQPQASAPSSLARPWLSFLIPVYNVRRFLRECLLSVVAQVDESMEIVLLDDCSTDGSADLVRQLEIEFSSPTVRIVTRFHSSNQGISAVRNGLLDTARGEYVWFLDSDDCLVPGAVEQLRQLVRREQPDLVLCDYSVWRPVQHRKHRRRGELHRRTFIGPARQHLNDPSVLLRGLFEAGHLHCWSKIAKRSVWDGLRFPVGKFFEDVTLAAPLLLKARGVWYEPQVWVAYRQWEGSILATPSPLKARHLAESLLDLPAVVGDRAVDASARFAWSHFLARHFICIAREAHAAVPNACADAIAEYRDAFLKSCPMPLNDLYAAYAGRGWFLRALRLRRWLKQGSPTAAKA
ncbi:hypothetical protein CDN98_01270 [Roseateles terrae]|nr:hypothetical protein CDN98_01270 [Roseateles terrae]